MTQFVRVGSQPTDARGFEARVAWWYREILPSRWLGVAQRAGLGASRNTALS